MYYVGRSCKDPKQEGCDDVVMVFMLLNVCLFLKKFSVSPANRAARVRSKEPCFVSGVLVRLSSG